MAVKKLQTVQFFAQEGEIHLGIGHPAASLLPKDLIQKASQSLFEQSNTDYLQYGAAAGDAHFRISLASFLSNTYGFSVPPETLLISNGISQALELLCARFTQPNDSIFVEEPSYFLALHIFKDHDLNIISIPLDEQGLNTDVLEDKLKTHKPKFVYTIPIHQNPSGVTLSEARRQKLLELAEMHDFLVLADEVYQLLSYSPDVPKPLAHFAMSERVISLGSFSKILAPGLRLGWIQTAPKFIERLLQRGVIRSGGGLNPMTSAVVKTALDLGLQDGYLNFLKRTYQENLETMDSALKDSAFSYHKPNGGYFFWLELPEGLKATSLHEVAQKHKVNFQVGSKFSSTGALENFIRLCFSYYRPAELKEGVTRLKKSLNEVMP